MIDAHHDAARNALRAGDLEAAEWHCNLARAIRQRRQKPTATTYLRMMLIAEELGDVRWSDTQKDWV